MRTTLSVCLVAAQLLSMSACGSKKPAQAPAPVEAVEPPAPTEHPTCVDDKDKPVLCSDDKDCCPGFVCGHDPDLNPRNRYCIYGG